MAIICSQLLDQISLAQTFYNPSLGKLHHLGFLVGSGIDLNNNFNFEKLIFHELMKAKMGYFYYQDLCIELIQPLEGSILHAKQPQHSEYLFDHCCYEVTSIESFTTGINISNFYTELFGSNVAFFLLDDLTKIELIEK